MRSTNPVAILGPAESISSHMKETISWADKLVKRLLALRTGEALNDAPRIHR